MSLRGGSRTEDEDWFPENPGVFVLFHGRCVSYDC